MRRPFAGVILIWGVFHALAAAQGVVPFTIYSELSLPVQKGVGAMFEWRYQRNAAFNLMMKWESFEEVSRFGVFPGELSADFTQLTLDTIFNVNWNPTHRVRTFFVGTGRPLPDIPAYVSIAACNFRLGRKFIFELKNKAWNWSLNPMISLTRHTFFAIQRQTESVGQLSKTSPLSGSYPYYYVVVETISKMTETQTMRTEQQWLPGLAYDIGLSRRLGKHWSVEARLSGLYNINTAFKSSKPKSVRATQLRGYLFLGYAFGKSRNRLKG